MSRGPGKRQRAILGALEERETFFLVDLLPINYTKANYNALNRAAVALADKGAIAIWTFTYCGGPRVAVCWPGGRCPDRNALRRIHESVVASGVSVGEAVTLSPVQHLSVAGVTA